LFLRKVFKNTSKFSNGGCITRETFFGVVNIVDEIVRLDKIIELKRISLRIDDGKCFFEEISFSFIRIFFFFIENSDENLEKFLVLDTLENEKIIVV
jgi:hypothetical protein